MKMNKTSHIIFAKSKEYFASNKSSNNSCENCKCLDGFEIKVPNVKYICNFNVVTYFIIDRKNGKKKNFYIFKFVILSKKIKTVNLDFYEYFSYKKKYSKICHENIFIFFESVKKILPTLSFNKLTGLFESETKMKNNLLEIKLNQEHMVIGECCICYENTITKTSCNHFICVKCWTDMKNIKSCPYCRCNNIKIKYN